MSKGIKNGKNCYTTPDIHLVNVYLDSQGNPLEQYDTIRNSLFLVEVSDTVRSASGRLTVGEKRWLPFSTNHQGIIDYARFSQDSNDGCIENSTRYKLKPKGGHRFIMPPLADLNYLMALAGEGWAKAIDAIYRGATEGVFNLQCETTATLRVE